MFADVYMESNFHMQEVKKIRCSSNNANHKQNYNGKPTTSNEQTRN